MKSSRSERTSGQRPRQGEYSSLTAAAAVATKQLGVGKESVRRWVIQSQGNAFAPEDVAGDVRDVLLQGGIHAANVLDPHDLQRGLE